MPAVHKNAISRKTNYFGTLCLFILDAWILGVVNQIIQKTQGLQISICSLLQAKDLVITQKKDDG